MNSVRELPENPWFEAGDERFRPGNLLVSIRNLDLVAVVDRASGEIVWSYQSDLSLQHEALMIDGDVDPGRRGNIQIFNNRYSSFRSDRRSEVIEVEPVSGEVVWRYAADGFYSATSGAQQPLPNGNVLIASSTAGRAFEVERSGRIVWEWVPGFLIDRPTRYAPDHCSELAALGPPDGPPVRPPSGYRHIDRETYRFSREGHRRKLKIEGKRREVLKPEFGCSRLLIPPNASADLQFGVDRQRVAAAGLEDYAATFRLTLTNPDGGGRATVLEETLGPDGPSWRQRTLGLEALADRWVEMCVELTETGLTADIEPGSLAFWASPRISAGLEPPEDEEIPKDLTAEELEVRREHLRAMGYVN